jgi:hypothetical protein
MSVSAKLYFDIYFQRNDGLKRHLSSPGILPRLPVAWDVKHWIKRLSHTMDTQAPIAVATWSKTSFCGRLRCCWGCWYEPRRGHGYLSFVNVVCCQVEISTSSWSLVQRSYTVWGVSDCDGEASIMRRFWSTRCCCSSGENLLTLKQITRIISQNGRTTFIKIRNET